MGAIPLEFLPYGRDFSIVLKVSKGIVPVPRHGDLFAGQPTAILQPAFADDRLQASHCQISPESEIVLARTYENDIPFLINHLDSTPNNNHMAQNRNQLLEEDFAVFRHFLRESFLVQLVHLDHFHLVRIRQRRINSFASDEFADPGH